jgi:hypothetical protein
MTADGTAVVANSKKIDPMLQGVLCLLFCESDQLIAWGRGSVLIGVLFYAVWAVAQHLSKSNSRNMDGARF